MKKQRGAIVVEATISLTTFVFAIFTILNIVNMCFVQAKIAVALNTAAKEISQYSYLYYALGINNLESEFHQGTADSRAIADETVDGIGVFMSAFGDMSSGAQTGDFNKMFDAAETGMNTVDSTITMYKDAARDDPMGFILGMAKMATDEAAQTGKSMLGATMAKAFMKKNLMSSSNDDPDAFLQRHKVVGGLNGLDFNYTTLMAYGESADIQLVVTYDIRVIQLLSVDFTFKIRQCSKTVAWGNGISILNKAQNSESGATEEKKPVENLWNNDNAAQRGKNLIAAEKAKYSYTASGYGFDAYSNAFGANEFVSIVTIDTELSSYQLESSIKSRLTQAYNGMKDSVEHMGDPITMKDSNGKTVTVPSDPSTRTYEIVIVIPDDADIGVLSQAVKSFKENNPGVDVKISQGYGSPDRAKK